jgi:hypothetical protein
MLGTMSLKYYTNVKLYHNVSNFPSSDGNVTEIRENLNAKTLFLLSSLHSTWGQQSSIMTKTLASCAVEIIFHELCYL